MNDRLIAIVDDDTDIIDLISHGLSREGCRVRGFSCAKDLFGFLDKEKPDLILLDIGLPGADGFEICKTLKNKAKFASIPIIIFSGRDKEADKISGLDAGSDDYIAKPCTIEEIKARMRAVLRRHGGENDKRKKIHIGDMVVMDLEKYEVTVEGKRVELTPVEFKILECLSSRKGNVFSRARILGFLWGEEKVVIERTIDVHIRHLREKLCKAGKFIKNVRGIGYKLEEDIS